MAAQRGKKTRHAGVYRTPDGRCWIRASVRLATGERREIAQFARSSLVDEAAAERAQLVAQIKQAAAPAIRASSPPPVPTVEAYGHRWIRLASRRVRRGTALHYADTLDPFVNRFAHRPADSLTRSDLAEWVAWAEAQTSDRTGKPYAAATLASWWRVVAQFCRDMAADFDAPDPTRRIRPPKGRRRNVRDKRTLTPAQLRQFLATVRAEWPAWWPEIHTLAFSGMRPGELYALQWGDVDEARGVIHVRRSVRRGHVNPPKTDDPREVALTPAMADVLRQHKTALETTGHPGAGGVIVFPTADGRHRGADALYKVCTLASRAAGLPIRVGPLVLRRTFNTLAVLDGVAGPVLRAQLGHASEAMTTRYAGVPAEAKRQVVERMAAKVVEPGGGTPPVPAAEP